jgi:hypothetical protein
MQTFIRLPNGKTITLDFTNGVTTIYDHKMFIIDREQGLIDVICSDIVPEDREIFFTGRCVVPKACLDRLIVRNKHGVSLTDDHVLTKEEFGDQVFHLEIKM